MRNPIAGTLYLHSELVFDFAVFSIDEDERRFIMDEEDDFYDSDDYDAAGRNDDDAFSTFFDGSADDYGGRDDYIDYQDNLANDISYDDGLDYANEVNVDDYTGNIVENL